MWQPVVYARCRIEHNSHQQDGLDEKIVQRRDGTAVYITQDIALVELKHKEFGAEQSIYVVGNEQDYHFKVLKLIAQKLGIEGADGIHHLSYGMVELPSGRMKTREGTVVDADDIVDEMESISAKHTLELGKVKDFTDDELNQLYESIIYRVYCSFIPVHVSKHDFQGIPVIALIQQFL